MAGVNSENGTGNNGSPSNAEQVELVDGEDHVDNRDEYFIDNYEHDGDFGLSDDDENAENGPQQQQLLNGIGSQILKRKAEVEQQIQSSSGTDVFSYAPAMYDRAFLGTLTNGKNFDTFLKL
jgi:hypothetical protein